jgi:hypothetical protein
MEKVYVEHEGNPEEVTSSIDQSPYLLTFERAHKTDSQAGRPVRQFFLSYRPAMLHRLAESNPRNRFLVSLNVYKYGLFWEIKMWW